MYEQPARHGILSQGDILDDCPLITGLEARATRLWT